MPKYRIKQNLPGGFKKDQVFELVKNKFPMVNGVVLPYDVETEPDFFERIPDPEYIGKKIMLLTSGTFTECNMSGAIKWAKNTLPKYTEFEVVNEVYENVTARKKSVFVIVKYNNGYYKIAESLFQLSTKYYFISSKGIVQSDFAGRDTKADEFRRSIGNFHNTQEEANNYKIKLQQLFK